VCFSAKADLLTGLVVGTIGVDAMLHVRSPSERVMAAISVVLAGHQLIESFVWLGLNGKVPKPVLRAAEFGYLTIAFGVIPVLVPAGVAAAELPGERKRATFLAASGAAVAGVLMDAVVRGPVTAGIRGHDIGYHVDLQHGGALVGLYVVATCGSLLMSTHRHVRWFGAVNLVVAGLLASLEQYGFISLWCVWAAISSVAIALHLRYARRRPLPSGFEWPSGDSAVKSDPSFSTLMARGRNWTKTARSSVTAAQPSWLHL
jgi:hypothetical protein